MPLLPATFAGRYPGVAVQVRHFDFSDPYGSPPGRDLPPTRPSGQLHRRPARGRTRGDPRRSRRACCRWRSVVADVPPRWWSGPPVPVPGPVWSAPLRRSRAAARFLAAWGNPDCYPLSSLVAAGTPAGPCATYPGDDTWTDTPFSAGVDGRHGRGGLPASGRVHDGPETVPDHLVNPGIPGQIRSA